MNNFFKILFTFLFFSTFAYSQTYRDTLVSEIIYNYPKDETSYERLKNNIKKLEKLEEQPNPEILYNKLSYVFQHKDTAYFKEILTLLTRKYGFNLSYASEDENYYHSIIYGELAEWFKEMYIKNHSEWLSENLDKQIDIYKLNKLTADDQLVHEAVLYIQNSTGLNEEQSKRMRKIDGEYFERNLETLLSIASKINAMPTGNSFALIQDGYGLVELHAMQHEDTFEKAWQSLYPLYKASYLNKNLSSISFRNIDSNMYIHNGTQIFNLLTIERVPEVLRKNPNDTEIPLANPEQTKKFREELGWE